MSITENILWRNSIRKGIFHRHTSEIQEITSNGVVIINEEANPPLESRFPWSTITNVIVMNQHSQGQGYHYTVGVGYGVRSYSGMNTYSSTSFGDVCFMSGGNIVAIFHQISDPHGVANLAKTQLQKH